MGNRLDPHPLAQLPVAVEAHVSEGDLLAVHVAKLRRGLPEPPLHRPRSVAQDGVELDHDETVRSQQFRQLLLVLDGLWGGGGGVRPKLSVIPDPLFGWVCKYGVATW